MNLANMADLVCSKVGKTDDASVAACKTYLQQRHEMLFDAFMWKDAIDEFEVDVVASATHAVLPFEAARPIAVWDKERGRNIDVTSLVSAVITNPTSLSEDSSLMKFVEVSSVGIPWELDSEGETIGASHLPSVTTDAGVVVGLSGIVATTERRQINLSVTLTSSPAAFQASLTSVTRITKPVTSDLVCITRMVDSSTFYIPASCQEATFARVRLLNPSAEALTLGILAKKKLRQMTLDSDGPMIRGSENALMAFAQGDMLERSRQYAKSASKIAEGTNLMGLMRDQELNQSAAEARIIPAVSVDEGEQTVW